MPPPRRPREAFGFSGATPLPGTERPLLSQTMEQRFSKAGLDPFLPYISPYETLARAQQYRGFDRALQQEDMEDQFFQSIKENPQTGFQKFITENPESLMSPYVRSYISTRAQLQRKQQEDPFEAKAAEGGTGALEAFRRGGGGVAGFAAAQDFITKNKPTKPDRPWQQRLSESEREKVREVVERAKALPDDFTKELKELQKEHPDLTEEAYVQRFKGDPTLEAYRKRRTFESAGPIVADLVDNYGLTEDEAVTALGIKQQPPARPRAQAPVPAVSPEQAAPAPAPVAAPQTSSLDGGPAAPAPAPVATPYTDDLLKIQERLPKSTGLERVKLLQREKDLKDSSEREKSRQKLEAERASQSAKEKELSDDWQTNLKSSIDKIMSKVEDIDDFKGASLMPANMLRRLGFNPKETAFTTKDGRKISWNEVGYRMYQTPEVMALIGDSMNPVDLARRDPSTGAVSAAPPRRVRVIREIK